MTAATPSSETDICNLALQRLGAKSISNLTEASVAGRECNRVYAHARDSELRSYPWSFARVLASLAADSTGPLFGLANSYTLPTDFIRLLPDNTVTDWQIRGRKINTDDSAPLKIEYIARVTDPNEFDELFLDLLVSRIALDIAEKLTQSNTKKDVAAKIYTAAKKEARKINSFENIGQVSPTDPWVTARL